MTTSFRCACGATFGCGRLLEAHECPRRHEPLGVRDLLRTLTRAERRSFELRAAGRTAREAGIIRRVAVGTEQVLRQRVRAKLGWRHDSLLLQARA